MLNYSRYSKIGLIFVFPQIFITIIFFVWPMIAAVVSSIFYNDAFGLHTYFAGFGNFLELFRQSEYLQAFKVSFILAVAITVITMVLGLLLALLIGQVIRGRAYYKALLLLPYAIAPAIAAILWRFLCQPHLGWITNIFKHFGVELNYLIHPNQALWLITVAGSWQQFSFNFLFYYAAIKAIPKPIIEASILDGASSLRRFWQIVLPLLSPTTFFLLSMNFIYAIFDTFAIIHIITRGGPGNSTTTLMYKVYNDGFMGMDFGSASAQSVLLMAMVILLTFLQFGLLEKKVHYR